MSILLLYGLGLLLTDQEVRAWLFDDKETYASEFIIDSKEIMQTMNDRKYSLVLQENDSNEFYSFIVDKNIWNLVNQNENYYIKLEIIPDRLHWNLLEIEVR
ncbi:hypothetical protein [Bacillus litorisediminis]|uniref:hypothetical protein n=1 Tax=Bacillus litorisediminis TaxID=2922713 RepID=UPI001FAC290A|nr:hypothetical protein [Bacillus litorisediminis]